MISKNCKFCGTMFQTYPSHNNMTCSKTCSYELRKKESFEKYKCTCSLCKKEFLPPRQKEGGLYCSYKCRGIDERYVSVDRNGYDYLFIPKHTSSSIQGYIAKHRIIYERLHGILLDKSMIVHHRDGNKKNNIISNLELMTPAEHSSHHMKENHKNNRIWTEEFRKRRLALMSNYKRSTN